MNVFLESDYRKCISHLVDERKARKETTLGKVAEMARMQKAHMTNVLKGRASFQGDQMYLICKSLRLSADESRYLMLLLEHERSALEERKNEIAGEIETLQRKNLQTEMHLSAEKSQSPGLGSEFPEYYLDPIHQIVHIAISIDKLSKDLKAMAEAVGVSMERLKGVLASLEAHGLIKRSKGQYVNMQKNVHLRKTSPVFKAWRHQLQNLALARSIEEGDEDRYGFSAVFSADEATRKKIQGKLLELIKDIEGDVKKAPAKGVYQISIDLFPWVRP